MLAIEALNIVNAHMSTLADQEEDKDDMMLFPYEFIRQKISTVNKDLYNNSPKQIPTYSINDDYHRDDFPRPHMVTELPFLVTNNDSFDFIKPNYILYQDAKIYKLIDQYETEMYRELTIWPGLIEIYERMHDSIMAYSINTNVDLDELNIDINDYFFP